MNLLIVLLASLCATALSVSKIINIASLELFPESIDYDTTTNTLIAGSLAQGVLVTVSMQGEVASFINDIEISGAGRGILGVQVDSVNRVVWACVVGLEGFEGNFAAFAGIAAYNLDTKQRKFLSTLNGIDENGDPRGVACHDVVHTTDGESAYITDSYGDRIFKVTLDGVVTLESADPLLEKNDQDELIGLTGIEINSQNELIISHQLNGVLLKYSLATNIVTKITGLPIGLSIAGDGIIFTNTAKTVLAVTDYSSGIVYSIELYKNNADILGIALVGGLNSLTCSVMVSGQIWALSGYMSEFLAGGTRGDYQLTKVDFPASGEPVRILLVIVVISMFVLVYLKE
jgi:hypothetical protein